MLAHSSQNIHEIIYETFRLLSAEHRLALYQVMHSHKTMMSFLLDLLGAFLFSPLRILIILDEIRSILPSQVLLLRLLSTDGRETIARTGSA